MKTIIYSILILLLLANCDSNDRKINHSSDNLRNEYLDFNIENLNSINQGFDSIHKLIEESYNANLIFVKDYKNDRIAYFLSNYSSLKTLADSYANDVASDYPVKVHLRKKLKDELFNLYPEKMDLIYSKTSEVMIIVLLKQHSIIMLIDDMGNVPFSSPVPESL